MADNHSHDDERNRLQTLIKTHNEYAIGALLKIYSFQTAQEQDAGRTYEDNSMGFNAVDAGFMSSLSEQFLKKGNLSDKQMGYVKRIIKKYISQLMNVGFEPVAINKTAELPQEIIRTAELTKNTVVIKFQYPKGDKRFYDMVKNIKKLPGRRYVKTEYCWKCPLSLEAVEKLIEFQFDFDVNLTEWHIKMTAKPELNCNLEIPGFKKELYPFQKEGVSFIESRNGRALIGDEMGLGKTIQALAYLELHHELRPALIVVPASLKINWLQEIKSCMKSEKVHIISGRKTYSLPESKSIFIINYDILAAWVDALKTINVRVIVGDEIHFIGNPKAARSKAFIKLCKGGEHIIGLSGTPIKNKTIEFFNPIKAVEPSLFPSRWNYAKQFCDLKHNGFGWIFSGASNVPELYKILTETIFLRRTKENVLKNLPPKTRTTIPIEIDNIIEYKQAEGDIITWIRQNEGEEKAKKAKQAETLVAFEKLKQFALDGKIKQCIAWIENFLESGQKLVIFAMHKKTIDLLINHFGKIAIKFDGSTPVNQRQEVVDIFQNDSKIKLFIGNIRAAGIGITLHASSNVCFLELPWTSSDLLQAEDRCHRIGQDNNVNVYYLIAHNTIEEKITALLKKKAKILDQALDGKSTKDINVFNELFKKLKTKEK